MESAVLRGPGRRCRTFAREGSRRVLASVWRAGVSGVTTAASAGKPRGHESESDISRSRSKALLEGSGDLLGRVQLGLGAELGLRADGAVRVRAHGQEPEAASPSAVRVRGRSERPARGLPAPGALPEPRLQADSQRPAVSVWPGQDPVRAVAPPIGTGPRTRYQGRVS